MSDVYRAEWEKWARLATLVFVIGCTTKDAARRDRCRELHRQYRQKLRRAIAAHRRK